MSHSTRLPIRVLAAVSPEAFPFLSTALGADFVLVFCASISIARATRYDSVDVVIASINFDDGRLFDLLRLCKSSADAGRLPFLCVKCMEGESEGATSEAVDIASKTLGGDGFVDLYRWMKHFGPDQSYEELRNLVETLVQYRQAEEKFRPESGSRKLTN
ncbi:hypothetical protein BH11PSE11_BH11PSE11_29600 [soil metagenome]